jgi:dTMP kinase
VAGRFITIEGPEGAGKTVQAERLAAALRQLGHGVVLTREPGGTTLGERVRSLVLDGGAGARGSAPIDPRADALLFNAARAQLVTEIVRPAMARGEVVLCARFADSTLAYQGHGSGLPLDELRAIAAVATGGLAPDRTILLDVAPEIGLARKVGDDRNRFEAAFGLEFHRLVREGFLELAHAEPDRWWVVDASRPADEVFADVLEAARSAL